MSEKRKGDFRRTEALSKSQIVHAAIELLDADGIEGLTFKALAARLKTGAGAIYWHIENKSELLASACDAIVAMVQQEPSEEGDPERSIGSFALGMFDAIDRHPWVGATLSLAPDQMAVLRILERIARDVLDLGVAADRHWPAVSTLFSYIVGVAGQNAANAQLARAQNLDRSEMLGAMASRWRSLDPAAFPLTRRLGAQLATHDDRADFISGVDFIVKGITMR